MLVDNATRKLVVILNNFLFVIPFWSKLIACVHLLFLTCSTVVKITFLIFIIYLNLTRTLTNLEN